MSEGLSNKASTITNGPNTRKFIIIRSTPAAIAIGKKAQRNKASPTRATTQEIVDIKRICNLRRIFEFVGTSE
jgi:hypothetical protein